MSATFRFQHANRGVLGFSDEALAVLRSYEQHKPDSLEAGGVLLGRYIRDCHDVVVDRVTEPMPGDRRCRFDFFMHADAHNAEITAAWESTKGTCQYLGHWHSHPEPWPRPSQIDWDDWVRKLEHEKVWNSATFFVIVGQRHIRAWQGIRGTRGIFPIWRVK